MKRYEFLEHTADAKFRAYGKTPDEAFANAALAMASLMYDPECVAEKQKKGIKAEGNDMEQLLYKFLEEFLVLQDSKQFIIHGFSSQPKIIKTGGKFSVAAVASGDVIGAGNKYKVRPVVKAVTYNEMKISQKPVYVQVVVDI